MSTAASQILVMLHIGLGSFHRAHQAYYMQALITSGDTRWQLAAGNIRPDMADTVTALDAQGGAYTLETISPAGEHVYSRITSIADVVPFEPSLSGLIVRAAQPSTRIISFTVTEAGYYLDAHDCLDASLADVAADLAAARGQSAMVATGSTVYGAMTAMLRARRAANAGPITLLNCDNLLHNGKRFRGGLLRFIELTGDTALFDWVQTHTTCPNAMVDRITPRPTPEVAARVLAATGWADAVPVMSENFIQWVIEEQFCAGRPAWGAVGVQMVESVAPYEEAKIRLLNATHSCIAWAGTLVGYRYIHEGIHDAVIRSFAFDYVTDDAIPVLRSADQPSPVDLPKYRDVVLERFANPAIADTNQRVAMDGYSKIPGFIAPTIVQRLARNESIASVAMLPALFLAYLQLWHTNRLDYVYQDQAMEPVSAHAICDAADPVAAFCADAVLWGPLAGDARLTHAVRGAYARVSLFIKAT